MAKSADTKLDPDDDLFTTNPELQWKPVNDGNRYWDKDFWNRETSKASGGDGDSLGDCTRRLNFGADGRKNSRPDVDRFSFTDEVCHDAAHNIPPAAYRLGAVAGAMAKYGGKVVGIMVTASCFEPPTMCIKIFDPEGQVIDKNWQEIANKFLNYSEASVKNGFAWLERSYPPCKGSEKAYVVGAIDNSNGASHVLNSIKFGVWKASAGFKDLGMLTTPQFRYFVRGMNDPYGRVSNESEYFRQVANPFLVLARLAESGREFGQTYPRTVFVDCANGVIASKLKDMLDTYIPAEVINVQLRNTKNVNKINFQNGPTEAVLPIRELLSAFVKVPTGGRCASFDADGTRLVYFVCSSDVLGARFMEPIGGDKIAALFATYLKQQINNAGLSKESFSIGVVQCAFADTASVEYLRQVLEVNCQTVATGAERMRNAALQFDVGIYFDPTGYGGVVFSERFRTRIFVEDDSNDAAFRLQKVVAMANDVCADGLTNFLLVEAILMHYGWTATEWAFERPYRSNTTVQLSLQLKNMEVFKASEDETHLVEEPPGFSAKVNERMAMLNKKFSKSFGTFDETRCRWLLRPSKTEECLHVHGQGVTVQHAKYIALMVARVACSDADGAELNTNNYWEVMRPF